METTPNTNMPPFYPGQKVVYITGLSMPKDSIHTVMNMYQYPCRCWAVDIGMKEGKLTQFHCSRHNADNENGPGFTSWFKASSFRPVQEAKMIRVSFEKIVEEIPVIAN